VSVEDAWLFPVVRARTHPISIRRERSPSDSRQFGSFALYGLYMIIKYYGSEWINFVLKWYFVTIGVGSVWAVSVTFVTWYPSSCVLRSRWNIRHSGHWFASRSARPAGSRLRGIP